MKHKVLIIDNSLDTTGALRSVLNYCLFARDRFDFIFVLPEGSNASAGLRAQQFQVCELPFVEISKKFRNLILYLPRLVQNAIRLKRIIKEQGVTLVHVNDFYNLTAITSRIIGGDFILTCHVRFMPDRFPLLRRIWIKLNLKCAAAIICVSNAVRRFLPDHPGIHVIHDGLLQSPVRCYKDHAPIRLLYLSHYIRGKGQDYAIEAFHRAFKQYPNIRLKFVGGDMGLEKNRDFKRALKDRVKTLQLDHVVEFAGPVADVRREFETASILLNFSESESFSMTCLEALAFGIPLIASDCGGPAELFDHGDSGLLVPNRDVDGMAAAIIRLSADGNLRKKFSINGMQLVQKRFSPENTYGIMLNLQLRLLGSDAS